MPEQEEKLKGHTPGQMLLAVAINKVRANKATNLNKPVSEIEQGVIDMNKIAQVNKQDQTRHIRRGARIGGGIGAGIGAAASGIPTLAMSHMSGLPNKIKIPATVVSSLLGALAGGTGGASIGTGIGALKHANAYEQGFIDKCNAMGVDPNQFIKQSVSATPIADVAGKLLKAIAPAVAGVKGVGSQAGNIAQDVGATAVNAGKEVASTAKGMWPGVKRVGAEVGKTIEKHPNYTAGAAGAAGIGVGAAGTSALDRHVTPTNKPAIKSTKPGLKKKAGVGSELLTALRNLGGTSKRVGQTMWNATKGIPEHANLPGSTAIIDGNRIGIKDAIRERLGVAGRESGKALGEAGKGVWDATKNVARVHPYLTAGGLTAGGGVAGYELGKEGCDLKCTQDKVNKGIGEAKDWMKRKGKATMSAGSKAVEEVKKANVSDAYTHGFIDKCASMGIDAEALIKQAQLPRTNTPMAPTNNVMTNMPVAKSNPAPVNPNDALKKNMAGNKATGVTPTYTGMNKGIAPGGF